MASLKEIKARISSVKSTLKITQAMKMVASAKLRKAQKMVAGLDAYKSALNEILQRLSQKTSSSSLAVPQPSAKRVAIVVFSSNTALCGSYNSNIFKALEARIAGVEAAGNPVTVFPVGEKVAKMARKAGRDVNSDFVSAGDNLSYDDMASLAQFFVDGFVAGRFARVELLYMHYYSASRQSIEDDTWLPLKASAAVVSDGQEPLADDVIVEPSEREVVQKLLPLAMRTDMYATLLSSNASENACRMIAMQTASDNAQDLLQQLQLTYNKQRQQDITEELTDISNGKLA
ncbi:MAG: ATP synthase F1 subunit gamma [Bacteroidales bacterium]|nr:ATP synthase F1 subunit gamma [Bacteroidales bacterium]